jgi:AcrR family transcriptional regulator
LKKQAKNIDTNTEQKILVSARNIFHRKGLSGARMQEIADDAGINKAMLHYYYSSKDKLFDAVFREAVKRIFPEISGLLNIDKPLFEKIRFFSDKYISLLQNNMYLPSFILNEMNQNPAKFKKTLSKEINIKPGVFVSQIRKGIEDKIIINIDPLQLFVNMISLCVFPFAAKPMIMMTAGFSEKEYSDFIDKRKKEIPEFIINSIKVK